MKKNSVIKLVFILASLCIISIFINHKINFDFIISISLIVTLYIILYSKHNIKQSYRQLEILITLYNDLNITQVMPKTNALDDYAANPDFLVLINDLIKENKPKTIIEAGSGVSTLIVAYSLKKYSDGKIFSLDHEKKYADLTRRGIKKHNLHNYADIIYSPLISYNNKYLWYDINLLPNIENIDLLIIDGPPSKVAKNSRYPAIPILIDILKKDSIILFDDCKRKDEKEVIALIENKYDCFEFKYIENQKGACIIKKINENC